MDDELYGTTPEEKIQVDHWLTFSIGPLTSRRDDFLNAVTYLNQILGPITYLVGKRFTLADFSVYAALHSKYIQQTL